MKSEIEIMQAHDLLVAIILGELPSDITPLSKQAITYSADVLCWVLQHQHNKTFEVNLAALKSQVNPVNFPA